MLTQELTNKVINGVLFQLGWFICLLAGDIVALIFLIFVLCIHQRYLVKNKNEWTLILAVSVFGLLLDSVLTVVGIFQFENVSAGYIPIWLVCLWCLFATTLCHSMQWLHGYIKWTPLVGGLAAACSYFGGYRLGAVEFSNSLLLSLFYIGFAWMLVFPIMIVYARKLTSDKVIK